jgi:hypothetical protein
MKRPGIVIGIFLICSSLPLDAQRAVFRGSVGAAPRPVVPPVASRSTFTFRPNVANHVRTPRIWIPSTVPFYDPFYWGTPAYYPQQQPEVTQTAQDDEGQRQIYELSNQVEQLTQEVQRLHDEQQLRQPPPEPVIQTPQPPTVLVFRDGHQIETQGYAIVGSTIWVFVGQATGKFPISDLNLEATQKANDERGIRFLLPR